MIALQSFQAAIIEGGKMLVQLPHNTGTESYYINGKLAETHRLVINETDVVTKKQTMPRKLEFITHNGVECTEKYDAVKEFVNSVDGLQYESSENIEKYAAIKKFLEECVLTYSEPEVIETPVNFKILGYLIDTGSEYIECLLSNGVISGTNFFTVLAEKFAESEFYRLCKKYGLQPVGTNGWGFAKNNGEYIVGNATRFYDQKEKYVFSLDIAREKLSEITEKMENYFFVKYANKTVDAISLKETVGFLDKITVLLEKIEAKHKSESDKMRLLREIEAFRLKLIDSSKD